ncbi:MAG TPA: nitrate- and nitrite sensing domain-containing protein [Actinoplanes sp.]|nr:nitrate- and nitrite sensing domain-containing protein [Actinoplanes sp.]
MKRPRLDPRLGAGLLLLVALWLAAAVPAVLDAAGRVRERNTADRLGRAVDTAVVALQDERRASLVRLAGGDATALTAARERTDRARDELRSLDGRWAYTESAGALVSSLDALDVVRSQLDHGEMESAAVFGAYGSVIRDGLGLSWLPAGPLGRAREALSQEDAMLRTALGTTAGAGEADRLRVGELAGERRAWLAAAGASAEAGSAADPGSSAGPGAVASADGQRLAAIEDRLILDKGQRVTPAEWAAAADPVNAALRAAETSAARAAVEDATPAAIGATVYAGLVAGVGLVALLGVVALVRRFRPTYPPVAAAPAEADGAGLQDLLLDLHRRSQRLVHRLLRLLDGLERRQSDEEMLGQLYRADHLATRVRRNTEKAITLAGGAPGRQWRRPMPLGEVVRGAAAEVDGYVRVSTSQIEPAALAGDAVLEITHLLAELIDNAVSYSPAETRVRTGGRWADGGYTVTVADAGPGMSDLDLDRAREVMADPRPPTGGLWQGFYAVGRFAARRGVGVRLLRGPAGGLVAEVALPAGLVSHPEAAEHRPGGPPINRVDRMRARLSEVDTTSVDLSNVGHGAASEAEAQ